MSLQKIDDQITREGLIARFYNAFCTGIDTKQQALDLVSEIAQAVDGKRAFTPSASTGDQPATKSAGKKKTKESLAKHVARLA